MKKSFLLLFVVVATIMTSCEGWLTGKSDHSPEIYASFFYVNPVFEGDSIVSAKDTLYLSQDPSDGSYELDTVYLGDTVHFVNVYNAYENSLVAVQMTWDSLRMDLWYHLPEDIQKALTNQSKVETGLLYFEPGWGVVTFPVYFTPRHRGGMTLKLAVESTSENFPTSSVLIYIPATEQVVDSTATN